MVSTGSILVTGANGGLGTAIVSNILNSKKDLYGLYTVRNPARAPDLQRTLGHASSTHKYKILGLQLDDLTDIRKAAKSINARVSEGTIPPIRAIILNAAFQEHTTQTFTK